MLNGGAVFFANLFVVVQCGTIQVKGKHFPVHGISAISV